ncbi:MAG TPA: hypothetical protein VE988_14055 [Gemmataceae bacterium]|nr:hypothetical protein [Gemmataceae bacterium]
MVDVIKELKEWYADAANTYVSGNLLIFCAEGDKRKHVAPGVFLVLGGG